MNGQVTAETLETTNNQVRDCGIKSKFSYRGANRDLDGGVLTTGDDNLSNVATATNMSQSRRNVVEAESGNGLDGLDVTSIDKIKNFIK